MTEKEVNDFMESKDFTCQYKCPMKDGHFQSHFEYQNSEERRHGALEIPKYFVIVKDNGDFKCSYNVGFSGTTLGTGWSGLITNDKLRTHTLKRFEEQIAILHQYCE